MREMREIGREKDTERKEERKLRFELGTVQQLSEGGS